MMDEATSPPERKFFCRCCKRVLPDFERETSLLQILDFYVGRCEFCNADYHFHREHMDSDEESRDLEENSHMADYFEAFGRSYPHWYSSRAFNKTEIVAAWHEYLEGVE